MKPGGKKTTPAGAAGTSKQPARTAKHKYNPVLAHTHTNTPNDPESDDDTAHNVFGYSVPAHMLRNLSNIFPLIHYVMKGGCQLL